MAQLPDTAALKGDDEVKVGDRIILDKNKKGQVRWVGVNKVLGVGTMYGVRLVDKRGDCDGTYKEQKLFWCEPGYGIVVPRRRISARYSKEDYDFMDEKKPRIEDPSVARIRANRKKIQRMKAKFRAMDKDGNMLVDVKEFRKLAAEIFPKMTEADAKKLFLEIDVSKSGSVSFAEFDSWISSLGGLHVMENKDFAAIRSKFAEMDKDGDAKIDTSEFLAVCKQLFPKLSSAEAGNLFAEIDTSNDGFIQFKEYDAWVKTQGGVDKV